MEQTLLKFKIVIDQDLKDPKKFYPQDEASSSFLKFIKRDYLTLEDLEELRSIRFEFVIKGYESDPITGPVKIRQSSVIWHNNNARRYFGCTLDKKGFLTSPTATASSFYDAIAKVEIAPYQITREEILDAVIEQIRDDRDEREFNEKEENK